MLDSCTNFKQYVDKAAELGQKAIASTEHGKPLQWVQKKMYCDAKGIKFLFGVECYLTKELTQLDKASGEYRKVRDNYHTILIARDYKGLQEINQAITISTDEAHTYYVNRITFDEFLRLSSHVIATSACLASPLNKLSCDDPWYQKLLRRYDFLEIQPHNCPDQIAFNRHLAALSKEHRKPLIAGTDAHSLDAYKAECRALLMDAKNQHYDGEEGMDLVYKSYDELVDAFRKQDAIPEPLWMEAIENTNVLADMVEDFDLDLTLKYPKLYGSVEADHKKLTEVTHQKYKEKLMNGVIPTHEKPGFDAAIPEELNVFEQLEMSGYILCMSEMIRWCWENNIPVGPSRGSVGGSRIAYITDITDLNPERWGTMFSRFANPARREVGDIDIDVTDADRPKVFQYLVNRFGQAYTARVPTWGTAADAHAIEIICMGLRNRWETAHGNPEAAKKKKYSENNPYNVKACERIKKEFADNPERAKKNHHDIFYYHKGVLGTKVSQSVHAAGIVVSPVTLQDNYGCFWKDGELVINIDMEEIHEVSLVKFDLLIVNNIGIIRDTCEMVGIPYPKTHQINMDDPIVWEDMKRSSVGIFQMEKPYAFKMLREYSPKSIFEMALLNACMRPSGETYRDDLIARKPHKNPSELIDKLLERNGHYLVFQEDTLRFLQEICGLSGTEADNIRRAIGRKQEDRLLEALPRILDGYCAKSGKPRKLAEQEAQEFIQILKDSASYQFNYSHAVGYSFIGYFCAYFRCYYPGEFITTYLNHAKNDDDIIGGTDLAREYKIRILPPRFETSTSEYTYNKETNRISKGLSSLKGYGKAVCDQLYSVGQKRHAYFMDVLMELNSMGIKAAKVQPLIQIDYFASYGNIPTLSRLLEAFDFYRQGTAKTIKKSKVAGTSMESILSRYAAGCNAKGKELLSWTITDMNGLLHELEHEIKSLQLPDVSIKVKMQNQLDLLGYISVTTGREEDRRKLVVMDLFPLISKDGRNLIWAYVLQCRSLGSGKTTNFTVYAHRYHKMPVKKLDIIYAKEYNKNKRGYWYLLDYDMIG